MPWNVFTKTLMRYFPLLLPLLVVSSACDSATRGQAAPSQSSSPQQSTPRTSQAVKPDRVIKTEKLSPQPIRIALNQLPPPYASESASKSPDVVSIPQNPVLRVPSGFVVNVFAEGLDRPRWLALTPDGDVLVTETRQNRIRRLRDTNRDGVADVKETFANPSNGLNQPFGMAFAGNSFFLGNTDAVLRFPYQKGQAQITGTGQQIAQLPAEGYNNHWTRNVVTAPDRKKLYVSIGSSTNASEEPAPRASVQVMNLDGSGRQTFASGVRNPVGLDFHPRTGELYTTVNERDGLGDSLSARLFDAAAIGRILRLALYLFEPRSP